jgi:hypothetical protein
MELKQKKWFSKKSIKQAVAEVESGGVSMIVAGLLNLRVDDSP